MYLGIDLGTSGLKAVVVDANGQLVASATAGLKVSRPKPLWSEQWPEDWWNALEVCLDELITRAPLADVKAIGLSGQMHGATLLGIDNQILRPAILWNDGRCEEQCRQIESEVSASREILWQHHNARLYRAQIALGKAE